MESGHIPKMNDNISCFHHKFDSSRFCVIFLQDNRQDIEVSTQLRHEESWLVAYVPS